MDGNCNRGWEPGWTPLPLNIRSRCRCSSRHRVFGPGGPAGGGSSEAKWRQGSHHGPLEAASPKLARAAATRYGPWLTPSRPELVRASSGSIGSLVLTQGTVSPPATVRETSRCLWVAPMLDQKSKRHFLVDTCTSFLNLPCQPCWSRYTLLGRLPCSPALPGSGFFLEIPFFKSNFPNFGCKLLENF